MRVKPIDNYNNLIWLDKYLIKHKGFVAGGCFKNIFNSKKVKDVDIFFRNQIDFFEALDYFNSKLTDGEYTKHYSNDNVEAFKDDKGIVIELIRKTFGTPEEIINSFDFTITKFAYFKEENDENIKTKVMFHDDFFEHLHMKRLVIDDKIPFPANTFERIIRYGKYGYMPCRETKLKLLEAIRGMQGEFDISKSLYDGWD